MASLRRTLHLVSPVFVLRRHYILFVGLFIVIPAAGAAATTVAVERTETAPVFKQVRLTGTVTSPEVSQVSTSVGGLVKAVHVDTGDHVAAGAPLLDLDRRLESLTLQQAQAATREAREELADARRRLAEARRLIREQSVSESRVQSLEAEVRIDAAVVERLEAEERHQAERLARHGVTAPFAGVVSRKLTAPGEWVEPGTAVVELVNLNGLRLDFQSPQTYYPQIGQDTEVSVRLDALPDRPLKGHVTATIPVSDPDARTFTVRVHLDHEDVPVIPGMSAHGELKLATGRRSVVVPRDALIRYPDGRITVWVLNNTNGEPTVSERRVETGLTFDGRVEIRAGLQSGTRVVVRGNEALQEGQNVRLYGSE